MVILPRYSGPAARLQLGRTHLARMIRWMFRRHPSGRVILRPVIWRQAMQHPVTDQVAPQDRGELYEQLGTASAQLSQGLAGREGSDAWTDYLGVNRIVELMDVGATKQLRELLTHYDGVVANPELREITAINGFAETRRLLRLYVQ